MVRTLIQKRREPTGRAEAWTTASLREECGPHVRQTEGTLKSRFQASPGVTSAMHARGSATPRQRSTKAGKAFKVPPANTLSSRSRRAGIPVLWSGDRWILRKVRTLFQRKVLSKADWIDTASASPIGPACLVRKTHTPTFMTAPVNPIASQGKMEIRAIFQQAAGGPLPLYRTPGCWVFASGCWSAALGFGWWRGCSPASRPGCRGSPATCHPD